MPVLVSPLALRQMNCGQIDVCIMTKKNNQRKIIIIEAKSGSGEVSRVQRRRLLASLELLTVATGLFGELIIEGQYDAEGRDYTN